MKDGEQNHSMGSPMDGTPPQSEDQWRSSNQRQSHSPSAHHPFMINNCTQQSTHNFIKTRAYIKVQIALSWEVSIGSLDMCV